jgi:hypothetical protein
MAAPSTLHWIRNGLEGTITIAFTGAPSPEPAQKVLRDIRNSLAGATTIVLSWFQRLKKTLIDGVSKIDFLTRYAWIQRLLQRLEPTESRPHDEKESEDTNVCEDLSVAYADVDEVDVPGSDDYDDDVDYLDERLKYNWAKIDLKLADILTINRFPKRMPTDMHDEILMKPQCSGERGVNTVWINEKVDWSQSSVLLHVGNIMNIEPICEKGIKRIKRIEQPFRVHDQLVEEATKALQGPIGNIERNTGHVKEMFEPIVNTSDVAIGGRGIKVQNGPADPFFTAPVGKEASYADFTTSRCLFIDPFKGEHGMTDEIWYSMLADAYDAGLTDGYSSSTVFLRDCCVDVTATNFSYDSATGADVMDSFAAMGAGSKTVLHYVYFAGQRATKPPATFKVGRSFNSGVSGQERPSFNVRFSAFSK